MLPYIQIPPLELGSLRIYPFALLVAVGVVAGHAWAVRESKRQGLSPESTMVMGWCMVALAFLCSWLFRAAYQPGWPRGIASFGGIFGGLAGAWLYRGARWKSQDLLRYLDVFTCAFAIGWILGRTGCSIAHDHLGRRTTSWFAVDGPGGPRYDLGLIELAFLIALAPALVKLNRNLHPPGATLGVLLTVYGVFRIWLDTLHEEPPRWLCFTVDQWAGGVTVLAGLCILGVTFSVRIGPQFTNSATWP